MKPSTRFYCRDSQFPHRPANVANQREEMRREVARYTFAEQRAKIYYYSRESLATGSRVQALSIGVLQTFPLNTTCGTY